MISELITFRITKAKVNVKYGLKYLCEHECERSFVPINIISKARPTKYLGGIDFTVTCVATVLTKSSWACYFRICLAIDLIYANAREPDF